MIASGFFSVYSMGVDTVFLCFREFKFSSAGISLSCQFGAFHFGAQQYGVCQFGAFHFGVMYTEVPNRKRHKAVDLPP